MKTLALVIALAACTGANAESIRGVRPSEPKPVMLVPPALVTAAVPSVRIAPEGNSAAESAAPEAGLQGGNAVGAAVAKAQTAPEAIATAESAAPEAQLPSGNSVNGAIAQAQTFPESSAAQSAKPGECRIGSASPIQESEPRKTGAMPEPKSDADCSLTGIDAKKRMLSGPWSAAPRLKAARMPGHYEEPKPSEAMLDDLLGKAIFEEPD